MPSPISMDMFGLAKPPPPAPIPKTFNLPPKSLKPETETVQTVVKEAAKQAVVVEKQIVQEAVKDANLAKDAKNAAAKKNSNPYLVNPMGRTRKNKH
jgi:hypothetical protein